MNNTKHYLVIFILILNISFANAQQSRVISLQEAIELGLQNSKYLKIDDTKIDQATANYLRAKNNQLPDLKVSASALALANANVKMSFFPPTMGNEIPKPNSLYYGNVSLSYPIFAGGKIKYGIKSSEYLLEAEKLSKENDKTAIAFNIAQAYNNLFKVKQTITVLTENLKAAQARDQTFLNLEKNGVLAKNDRLKANLQTSDLELQLLDAQSNSQVAMLNMNIMLGLPDNTLIETDPEYLNDTLHDETLSYYLDWAQKNRKDLQINEYQQKAAQEGKKIADAENYPTIALTAGYIAGDIPKILTLYNAANIGVGISYNLSNLWKKNTDLIKSEAQIKGLQLTNEMLNDQIKLEINQSFQKYIFSQKKIEISERALAQANENYRITKNKYDNGLETITNLLEADAARISADINLITSKADAVLAYKKLLQTSGILISK